MIASCQNWLRRPLPTWLASYESTRSKKCWVATSQNHLVGFLSPHDPTRISNHDRLVFSIPRKGQILLEWNSPGSHFPESNGYIYPPYIHEISSQKKKMPHHLVDIFPLYIHRITMVGLLHDRSPKSQVQAMTRTSIVSSWWTGSTPPERSPRSLGARPGNLSFLAVLFSMK